MRSRHGSLPEVSSIWLVYLVVYPVVAEHPVFIIALRLASTVSDDLFFKNYASDAILYLEHAYLGNEELDTLALTNECSKVGTRSFNLSSANIFVASAIRVHRHFKVVSFNLRDYSTLAVHGEGSQSVAKAVKRVLLMNFIEHFIRHALGDTGSDVRTRDEILANQENWETILTVSRMRIGGAL